LQLLLGLLLRCEYFEGLSIAFGLGGVLWVLFEYGFSLVDASSSVKHHESRSPTMALEILAGSSGKMCYRLSNQPQAPQQMEPPRRAVASAPLRRTTAT
jgi:hypothetical protein